MPFKKKIIKIYNNEIKDKTTRKIVTDIDTVDTEKNGNIKQNYITVRLIYFYFR